MTTRGHAVVNAAGEVLHETIRRLRRDAVKQAERLTGKDWTELRDRWKCRTENVEIRVAPTQRPKT